MSLLINGPVLKAKARLCINVVLTGTPRQSKMFRPSKVKYFSLLSSYHTAKRQNGVGIAVEVDEGIEIEEIPMVSARIVVANVLLYGCSLRVICCYAPTEEDSYSSKNVLYSRLNKQFECENIRKIICLLISYLV